MDEKVKLQQKNPDILEILQFTDCHIFSTAEGRFEGVDTAASLARVIDRINGSESPDLVLVTGDLVHDGVATAYERLLARLKDLHFPVYCLPGNHDDPALMHEFINSGNVLTRKLLDSGRWRIILLDTVLLEEHSGYLSREELSFLDESLSGAGENHVLVVMHHHPVSVNSPWMDTMILKNSDEFFTVIDRYPKVRGIAWGHIHQEFFRVRNDVILLGTPSTCIQFKLEAQTSATDDKPPAYRLIRLHGDGSLNTEVRWLSD